MRHVTGKAMMNKKHCYGFSLVELLVAMVVGLIIVTGAFSLHSVTRKTQKINEAQMDMVADARFAIEMIAYDLRHAGMWGSTNQDGLINCRSTDASCTGADIPTAPTNDCVAAGWAYNLTRSVFASNGVNPYSATCIPAAQGYVAGTDILEVRYADSNPLPLPPGLIPGQAYVRSNFINGKVFVGATQPVLFAQDAAVTTNNHTLHAFAYYISNHTDATGDGIPSLRRATLVNGPEIQNQTILSGVVNLRVQFGEDLVGNDQIVDSYLDVNNVTNWNEVYAAKVWLVMRSDMPQPGIDTSKTFNIAGTPVTYGGVGGFRHFMVTSVVNLRNLKQL